MIKNYRDKIKWRSWLSVVCFLPMLAIIMGVAFLIYFQPQFMSIGLLFVFIAYVAGYAMALIRVDNTDAALGRMGDMEIIRLQALMDQELAWRKARETST